jgi:hypothetical protein
MPSAAEPATASAANRVQRFAGKAKAEGAMTAPAATIANMCAGEIVSQ